MKMEYCEFKEMLRAALEKHFEGAAEVSVTTQQKLNHVDKEAITIREKEKEVFKNISLDGLYLAYSVTEDFGRCVEEIISICSEKEIASREDVPMVWDAARPGGCDDGMGCGTGESPDAAGEKRMELQNAGKRSILGISEVCGCVLCSDCADRGNERSRYR